MPPPALELELELVPELALLECFDDELLEPSPEELRVEPLEPEDEVFVVPLFEEELHATARAIPMNPKAAADDRTLMTALSRLHATRDAALIPRVHTARNAEVG